MFIESLALSSELPVLQFIVLSSEFFVPSEEFQQILKLCFYEFSEVELFFPVES